MRLNIILTSHVVSNKVYKFNQFKYNITIIFKSNCNMMLITKIYCGFSAGMASYGFTRGYRSRSFYERFGETDYLTADKIIHGLITSVEYAIPINNFIVFGRLINRLEIEYKQLDKEKFRDNYKELVGICNDTI